MSGGSAVFLDRDGVVNEVVARDGAPGPPWSLSELVIPPAVPAAVRRLREVPLPVFIVTNQPDVARGHLPAATLDRLMAAVRARIPVDDVRVCPHDDDDGCRCRKPLPGMVLDLAWSWGVDPAASFLVGDTWKDVGAGRAAGCRTVLLRRPYNTETEADHVVESLAEAVDLILARVTAP